MIRVLELVFFQSLPTSNVEETVGRLSANTGSPDEQVEEVVRDDGSFSFPSSTKAELGSSFAGVGVSISRSIITFHEQGDSLLVITRESSDF